MWIQIYLGLVVVAIVIILRIRRQYLRPLYLFPLIIFASLWISSLRLAEYQLEYTWKFILTISLGVVSFCIGCRFAAWTKNIEKKIDYDAYRLNIAVIALAALIAVSFCIEMIYLGPPPAISYSIRSEYFVSGWGSVVELIPLTWGIFVYDFYNEKHIKKTLFIVIGALLFLILFLLSNKTQIILLALITFIGNLWYKGELKVIKILILTLAILGVFEILYLYVYLEMYGVKIETISDQYMVKIPDSASFLIQPYIYIECNYDNLLNYMDNKHDFSYGLKTLKGFMDALYINKIYSNDIFESTNQWKEILRAKSLTTGSVFRDFVEDFGTWGIVIMPLFLGYVTEKIYKIHRTTNSFTVFFLFCVSTYSIFLSFFTNFFTSKTTIINIIAAALINSYIKKGNPAAMQAEEVSFGNEDIGRQ